MRISPAHYVGLSALLLTVGTAGILTRRNMIVLLMSVELVLNAANINLVTFSRTWHNAGGQVFALMVIVDAVAEAAVGLALLIALFRNRPTVLADQVDLLRW